jgi:hypothetical protein
VGELTAEERAAAARLEIEPEDWDDLVEEYGAATLGPISSRSAKLDRDLALLGEHFGERCQVTTRPSKMADKIVVEIDIDCRDILSSDTMRAWKLDPRHGRLTISLEVSKSIYVDTSQPIEKEYFSLYHKECRAGSDCIAVCVQLQYAVLWPFVERWWRSKDDGSSADHQARDADHVTGWPAASTARNYLAGAPMSAPLSQRLSTVEHAHAHVGGEDEQLSAALEASRATQPLQSEDEMIAAAMALSLGEQPATGGEVARAVAVDEELVCRLQAAVGADARREALVGALVLSHNDADRAFDMYFDAQEHCLAAGIAVAKASPRPAPGHEPEPEAVELDVAAGADLARQRSSGDRGGLDPTASASLPADCFLLDLVCYLMLRLPTLNRFCVVTDEPHLFEPMLIPTVSCRDLAVFTFQNLDGWWKLAAKDVAAQV